MFNVSSVWSVTATTKGEATSAIFSEGLLVGAESRNGH